MMGLNCVANIQLQIVVYLDQSCAVHQAVRHLFEAWLSFSVGAEWFNPINEDCLELSVIKYYIDPKLDSLQWRPGKGIWRDYSIIFYFLTN